MRSKNLEKVPDWAVHLKGIKDGDAWGKNLPKIINGIAEHAHHIVQKGLNNPDSKAAQRILEKWDIDWYMGRENLVWAVSRGFGNHTDAYRKVVRKLLEDADSKGRDVVIEGSIALPEGTANQFPDAAGSARIK